MEKDRTKTEKKIKKAVEDIVKDKGFSALGVNAVANKAGVAKMLIYRYFDSFENLLEKWAMENSYWITEASEIFSSEKNNLKTLGDSRNNTAEQVKQLFRKHIQVLRTDPVKREMSRWMLAEDSKIGRAVLNKTEQRGKEITEYFNNALKPQKDAAAYVAVLISGIQHLANNIDRVNEYNGISLTTDEGWNRIENAVMEIIDGF